MNDINFIKNIKSRNQQDNNKKFKISVLLLCLMFLLMATINMYQLYNIKIANELLKISKKDIEFLDIISKKNNEIKENIQQLQNQIIESENSIKLNENVINLITAIANIIPEDTYLESFDFKPLTNSGPDMPNNNQDLDLKNFGSGKIKLKGYTNSKSITEFLERVSRFEILDNVRLLYLRYPENNQSNLLEFSIKLLIK